MTVISIVLPVYNVEDYLERSLRSILSQSFEQFELIIINDGSTDNSGAICEAYAERDQRIQLLHQENQGLSMARNNGLKVATGDYIMFVDSDDWIHRDLLQVTYENLIHKQADISVADYALVYEDTAQEQIAYENKIQVLNNVEAVKQIVEQSQTKMIIACGKLYKKSLFEKIQYPRGKYHEDEFVTYKLLYRADKVVVTDAQLYFYLQRRESITGDSYSLKRLDKLKGLKEAIQFFEEQDEKELAIHAQARYLLNIQIAYYKVKYEMQPDPNVLEVLREEYAEEYKVLRQQEIDLSVFQRIIFKVFQLTPNLYSFIVKLILKSGLTVD